MAKQGYHHGNLAQALVDATLVLIEKKGPTGFTVSEAAKRAGVTPAAVYRHFDGREALIAECARQGYGIFAKAMETAYDSGQPSAMASFEATGRAYLAFARAHPGHYVAMFESGISVNRSPELHAAATRANGVLLTHSHPSGGIVSGQGSLMQLDGWTWEDMTVARSTGLILNWPNMLPRQSFFFAAAPEEQMSRRDEQLQQIEDLFDTAERYKLARENESIDFDARYEAMIPFLEGERPIFVDANESQQIQLAVAFCQRRGLKMVLLGGRDAGKVTEVLKAADVPVILIGTQRSPGARDASYDEAYRLPAVLHEAGVKFAIASDRRNSMARNLPYHVGAAIGFGLPEDVALACVTSHAAEILGVSDRVGTLEAGKDATLFVADGDIFETPTQVTHAWIGGRRTDLSSRHTQLNDKYKQRYGQE